VCAWIAADLSSALAQYSPDSPEAILSQLLQIAASPAALSSPDCADPNTPGADSAAPPSSSSSKLGGGLFSVLGRSVGSSGAQASSAAAQLPVGLRSANPADPTSVESRVVALLAQVMHENLIQHCQLRIFSIATLYFLCLPLLASLIQSCAVTSHLSWLCFLRVPVPCALQAAERVASPRAAVAAYHQASTSAPSSSSRSAAAVVEAEVSALLMAGAREAALTCAVQGKAWPLALLIASVCSADRYKEVIR